MPFHADLTALVAFSLSRRPRGKFVGIGVESQAAPVGLDTGTNKIMSIWTNLLDLFASALFALTHLYGGSLGLAIVTISLVFRLALLPVTLRIARRGLVMRKALKAIQPELERLRERHQKDPLRLQREVQKRYQRAGIRPFRDSGLVQTLLQMPFMAALYTVIREGVGPGGRFLWIANLARPDALLALLVTVSSGLLAALSANTSSGSEVRAAALISMIVTMLFLVRIASGVGLYWAASNVVGLVQAQLLRREAKRFEL